MPVWRQIGRGGSVGPVDEIACRRPDRNDYPPPENQGYRPSVPSLVFDQSDRIKNIEQHEWSYRKQKPGHEVEIREGPDQNGNAIKDQADD